ncbi:TRAP-type C4-dicarboxylate transport system, small permease component [Devosia enhydra]|uniref:TRAP transporter small permease protein n=1 Tax=Devosia enhydra TaxID=665118 RepID=A0A1K2HZR2_9HYPH|nr:TRAP transporter small permease subunit [Devosia enhydra]SFZ84722.1 TRAP-type C4-dicarboxylate transport system, small permease component [Devosia enhydra]
MIENLAAIGSWLRARAENLLAAMLAVMFIVFIIQIVFRYLLNLPIGWTHEISVMMWLYLVLFGTAFVVRDSEEIRFDLFYAAASPRVRRGMVVLTATTVVVLFTISLPAVIDYIAFMKVQRTAYLKIRFDWLYAIYGVFAVAVIVRQLWLGINALRGVDPVSVDPLKSTSGV